ncbi:Similar to S.cerevisiae protein YCH1 (Phosphatase with sequence similarity to Cdc25p) [Malassezia sympodialis ATCC 42132]|uniref:Similar to S.cerevisiae protein YCH1 (Phosphatase with sequence similarity to Cdc25p) n=1 Tax=Malassezia sympodialis (strain ATCC 42132) TaxID=1230383 RepID=A0A1M8A4D0_MALS4|nr:Similar to S.cerevisiae protein YCH1 (Phosphatase with sequence similarity to Cdc25p) [Malassezia sympodialis ATCC 42132]
MLRTGARHIAQTCIRHRFMSFQAPYKYIDADSLASMLKQRSENPRSVVVVDVRDDDYEGGHIAGAIHSPSSTFLDSVNDLLAKVRDYDNVVFHCALSQQRGPKAARIYREVRDATSMYQREADQVQEVLVLRDGFGFFGPKFKQDPQLVEDWDEESWKFR